MASRYLTWNANSCAGMLSSTSTNNENSNLKRKSLSHGRLKRMTSRGKFGRFDPPCCYQKPFFQALYCSKPRVSWLRLSFKRPKISTDEVSVFQYPKNKLAESKSVQQCYFRLPPTAKPPSWNANICATTLCLSSTDNEHSKSKRYTCAILLFSNTLLRLLSYNAAICYGTDATWKGYPRCERKILRFKPHRKPQESPQSPFISNISHSIICQNGLSPTRQPWNPNTSSVSRTK